MSRLGILLSTEEKEKFAEGLMTSLQEAIVKSLHNAPRGWDGWEIRWFVADYVARHAVLGNMKRRGSRYKAYKKSLRVNAPQSWRGWDICGHLIPHQTDRKE